MLTELISFAFPAALLMWRRRDPKYLPKKSPFNLGKFGWLVNTIVIGWTVFALVIFSFPIAQPVRPGSMSKCTGTCKYGAGELKRCLTRLYVPGSGHYDALISAELVLLRKEALPGSKCDAAC